LLSFEERLILAGISLGRKVDGLIVELENLQFSFIQSFNMSIDAMAILDANYTVMAVNQAFEKLFNLKKEKVIYRNIEELIIPRHLQEEAKQIYQAVLSGETVRTETERLSANGRTIPILLTEYPVTSPQKPDAVWVVYTDLTERVRFEKNLKESENRLRDFADAVPDVSFIVDEDGKYLEAFGDLQKMVGKSKNEIVGKYIHELFPPNIAQIFLSITQKTISSGIPNYITREMKKNGREIRGEERLIPLHYQVNNKKTVGVIITDITERLYTERMLYFVYELHRRSDFLNLLLLGDHNIGEQELSYAKELKIDFSIPMFCCILRSEKFSTVAVNPDYSEHKKFKYSLMELLAGDPDCIVWDCWDDIGVLYKEAKHISGNETSEELICRLKQKVQDFALGMKLIIGVGNSAMGPEGVKLSYKQALSGVLSVHCQKKNDDDIQIYYYRKLGLLKFLINYSEEEYVNEFVDETIGKLIKYDRKKGTDLLRTLEAIIKNYTLQAAANDIFLHPKTIYYRKQRIEKILGRSIDSIELRYAIALAINLYKIRYKIKLI
jgi:PAS domain S-box-containing protein